MKQLMKNRKHIGMKALLIMLLVLTAFVISGCGGNQGGKDTAAKSPEEIAISAVNPYKIEIFKQDRRYGLKRDGKVISDPVWSSIEEVIEGDLVYYVVGYYDKNRTEELRKTYDTPVDFDTLYGIVDSDGNLVVEPEYWRIECGRYVWDDKKVKHIVPYSGDFIVGSRFTEDGGEKSYITLGSGEKKTYKTLEKKEYMIRKKTWKEEFNLPAEYSVVDFHDDYIEFETAYNQGGIFSISQQKVLVFVEKTKGRWTYYPGIGFTAKAYNGGKDCFFISLDGTVLEADKRDEITVDQDHGIIWVPKDKGLTVYGSSHKCAFYRYDGTRIGDFLCDRPFFWANYTQSTPNETYVTDNGDWVQLVMNSKGEIQLFRFSTKELTTIENATRAGKWTEGFCPVGNDQNKWGYIKENGEFLVTYQFDEAKDFKDGKANVVDGYKLHTIDTSGNIDSGSN